MKSRKTKTTRSNRTVSNKKQARLGKRSIAIIASVGITLLGSGAAYALNSIDSNRTDTPRTAEDFEAIERITQELSTNKPKSSVGKETKQSGVSSVTGRTGIAATSSYQFLSAPDFLNADIGDVTRSPLYRKGKPNSTNTAYEKSLDTVFDAWEAENIRDMYVAGDLVEGHWGMDDFNTGTFGPVKTYKQRIAAAQRAGNLYYSQWLERFKERNLNVHAAIGDHEIGDNPWNKNAGQLGTFDQARFDYYNFGARKQVFGKHFLMENGKFKYASRPSGQANMSSYAFRPHPEVQMVMVDVFRKTSNSVAIELDGKQKQWLEGVLQRANSDGVKWIIVQGHTPVLTPVRKSGTLGLEYRNGAESAFWKLLKREKVDMYLNGEVHAITAHQQRDGEPVQISHGGMFVYGPGTNYMVAKINGDTITMDIKRFKMSNIKRSETQYLWQADKNKTQPKEVYYESEPYSVGEMTLSSDGKISQRTGLLDVYNGVR